MSRSTSPQDPNVDPESIFAEWATRVESGEPLDFQRVIDAHPSIENDLRHLHADWRALDPILAKLVPGLIASESGLVMPSLSGGPDTDEDAPSAELLARLRIHTPNAHRYRFRAVLGRGGGGVVLKVWDSKLNRPLAMKVVMGRDEVNPSDLTPRIDGKTLSRFADEARIASQLNHPGIVPVHELGADETGRAFFTMKLVRGENLSRVFEHVRGGTNGWSQLRALDVLLRVCEAMAYAHDRGVIHRDLKPANVMVGSYGEVYVMDWGLARVLSASEAIDRPRRRPPATGIDSIRSAQRETLPGSPLLTTAGSIVGTPSYMSPEQARGEIETMEAATDVYSLGAILYELIGGEAPYLQRGARVDARTIVMAVMNGPPTRLSTLAPRAPAELVAICERAMAREAGERYATMKALAADVRAFLEGRVVSAFETGTWAETRKWVLRNRALAASLASAAAIALLGAIAFAVKALEADQRAREAGIAKREAEVRTSDAQWNAYVAAVTGAAAAQRVGEPATVRRLLDSAPKELRRWEWGYLDALSDTSVAVLEGHALAFSPDSSRCVTACWDNTVRVWNATSGVQLARLVGHTADVRFAAFSRDGSLIVTASMDGTARVWDAGSGVQSVCLRHHSPVEFVAFSPDGSRILTKPNADPPRVWDAVTGAQIALLKGEFPAFSAALSPDGARVVTVYLGPTEVSGPDTVYVWDFASGALLVTLEGHAGWVTSATFSPDGSRIVTATGDSTPVRSTIARVWDAASGAQLAQLEGHSSAIRSIVFSPDGSRIVTASWDDTVRVWDAASGVQTTRLKGPTPSVDFATFSHDGERILTASSPQSCVRVWNAASGAQIARQDADQGWFVVMTGHRSLDAFSDDGSRYVTGSADGTARVWDSLSGRQIARLEGHTSPVYYSMFSPDGSRVVTEPRGGPARVWDTAPRAHIASLRGSEDVTPATISFDGSHILTVFENTACMWDTASSAQLLRLDGWMRYGPSNVSSAEFSPDGLRIVGVCWDNTARVWDVSSGVQVAHLKVEKGDVGWPISTATFSPDGSRIVTTSQAGNRAFDKSIACVWDVASGTQIAHLKADKCDAVSSATFSPDGSRIVTVCKTAHVWDVDSGVEVANLRGNSDWDTSCAAFSPDGSRIVTVDKNAHVWSVASGAQVALLEGYEREGAGPWLLVNSSPRFSPDGSRIVAAFYDNTARIWDAASGAQIARLEGHTNIVNSAAFSPDGARIVTASWDNTARVWDTATGIQLARLEGHTGSVVSAEFSSDGSRIVTSSSDRTVRVWDSVPYRTRFAEQEALRAARPAAQRALDEAIAASRNPVSAGTWLRHQSDLEPVVRRVAIDLLLQRSQPAKAPTNEPK